jgi:hypothetical protein
VNVEDRKGSSLIPNAMAEHIAQGYRNIASDAARDNPEAYGPFLRMMADAHTMLQPAKDEVARAAMDRGPIAPNFIRPKPAEDETPSQPSAPGTVILGGEEYA